jgi:hypothetical protein
MGCIYESLYYIFAANLNGLTIYFQITMTTLDAFAIYCAFYMFNRVGLLCLRQCGWWWQCGFSRDGGAIRRG